MEKDSIYYSDIKENAEKLLYKACTLRDNGALQASAEVYAESGKLLRELYNFSPERYFSSLARNYTDIGTVYFALERAETALKCFITANDILKKAINSGFAEKHDMSLYAECAVLIGNCHFISEEYSSAADYYNNGIFRYEKLEKFFGKDFESDTAYCRIKLGTALIADFEYYSAYDELQKAEKVYTELMYSDFRQYTEKLAECMILEGDVKSILGDEKSAEIFYRNSADLLRKLMYFSDKNCNVLLGWCFNSLGELYLRQGAEKRGRRYISASEELMKF